jgi:hypothetical protein
MGQIRDYMVTYVMRDKSVLTACRVEGHEAASVGNDAEGNIRVSSVSP